jgi:hypothetical protein
MIRETCSIWPLLTASISHRHKPFSMETSAQVLLPQSCSSMRIHATLIAVAKGEMDREGVAAVLRELTA